MTDELTTRIAPRSGAPIDGALRITVLAGPDRGASVVVPARQRATIGTLPDNTLTLSDDLVSRFHVELTPTAHGIALRDLGSSNGTWLGGVAVTEAVVPPETQIAVGATRLLVDVADRGAPASLPPLPDVPGLVYRSAAMAAVAREVLKCRAFAGGVLVEGETGTGKEVVAAALHRIGDRSQGPFVVVDCGALPANLVESHLFGHERGAFTSAERRRIGAFEEARGGTMFLDEIGELPLAVQPILLGVLERKRFRRVGGDADVESDVRVISATNRDLRAEVNRRAFRADLYFRLAGARIVLPPLRERLEDIPLLWEHFAREMTGGEPPPPLPPATLERLVAGHFAGNVRELRNLVERALAFGELPFDDAAPADAASAPPSMPPAKGASYRDARAQALNTFERHYLSALMSDCEQNASRAARVAGMDRGYLLSLLKRHGLR